MLHSSYGRSPDEEKVNGKMKHIFFKMKSAISLFHHKLSPRVFLRLAGIASLLLLTPFIFSNGLSYASIFHQSIMKRSNMQLVTNTSYSDIVFVIDNINEIQSYDQRGARFRAAQMIVDQVRPGNRVGIVRITSSDKPSPTKLLGLTSIQNSNDRSTIKRILTPNYFGPIDPGPIAYFVPPLQTASQMLLSTQDNNRKYIIIMTDSLAQSGDQEPCSSASDQFHEWFCVIPTLVSQHISVILYSFAIPGHEAKLQPTRQYLQQHGAVVLEVG